MIGASAQRVLARLVDRLPPGDGVDMVFEATGAASGLPFELLRLAALDGGSALRAVCLLPGVTVRRRVVAAPLAAPTTLAGPVKILAAIAAPDESETGNAPLDVEAEMQAVLDAVSGLTAGGGQVRILEVASLGQIQAALTEAEYHVLHLSAHGSATAIELEDEDGHPVRVGTADLMGALRRAGRPVPLIVLSSCSGAAADGEAMAAGLIGGGADRVLAMQAPVSDAYATRFAQLLYSGLDQHPDRPLAQQVAAARQQPESDAGSAPTAAPRRPEFGIPARLSAAADGAVVDMRGRPDPLADATEPVGYTNVRELPLGYLIGRRAELRAAMAVLRRHPAAVDRHGQTSGVLFCGIGGIGKTALTGRVISRLKQDGWAVAIHEGPWNPSRLFTAAARALAAAPDVATAPTCHRRSTDPGRLHN